MKVTVFCLALLACLVVTQKNPEPRIRNPPLKGPNVKSDQEREVIIWTLEDCAYLANQAYEKGQKRSDLVEEYFKTSTTDEARMKFIFDTFARIRDECSKLGQGHVEITTLDPKSKCTSPRYRDDPKSLIRSDVENGVILICPRMTQLDSVYSPAYSPTTMCGRTNAGSLLIRELSYMPELGHTQDYGTISYRGLMRLTGSQSRRHAGAYAMFAQAIDYERLHGKGTCSKLGGRRSDGSYPSSYIPPRRNPRLGGPTHVTPVWKKAIEDIIGDIADLADAAIKYLEDNDGKVLVKEYFKDTTPITIHEVRGVFIRISTEARKKGDGFIEFTTKDADNVCHGGVFAYTQPEESKIVTCRDLNQASVHENSVLRPPTPRYNQYCGSDSKVKTLLHEMTHVIPIKGTVDFNDEYQKVYTYDGIMKLSTEEALRHAETYARFAQAIAWENKHGKGTCTGRKTQWKPDGTGAYHDGSTYINDMRYTLNPYHGQPPIDPYHGHAPTNPYNRHPSINPYTGQPLINPYNRHPSINPYTGQPLINPYNRQPPINPYNRQPPTNPHNRFDLTNMRNDLPPINPRPFPRSSKRRQVESKGPRRSQIGI